MARQTSVLNKLPLLARSRRRRGVVLLVGVAYFVVFYGDVESSIKAAQEPRASSSGPISPTRARTSLPIKRTWPSSPIASSASAS